MSAIKKVGRPTIANSEVPAHIFEGLLHKSRGRTWADSATAVGIKYQTLKEWVNENEVARQFYKEQLKARNEIIQDNLDNSYELLIAEAPTVANELLKIIKNQKTKGYAKTEAINAFFRIIERGWSDKKMSEALQETKERIDSLEAGRPLQLTETPV
jgi:P2-related tail formation protein|tara:strand:+ start:776 stop:1246 length:471 start_codon:yes stop_codon:yes gene_type:complete